MINNMKTKIPQELKNWQKEKELIPYMIKMYCHKKHHSKELCYSAYSLEYADEIASLFELKNLYARHPQSLSEGQKRRLSIACVLASKPEVVLLDEPTVGQDYEFLAKLVNNLNYLHVKTNNTLITITHDIRCASALADESLIIKEKQIIKSGGKELIKEYFAS